MTGPSATELLRRFDRKAKRLESLTSEAMRLRRQGRLSLGSLDALFEAALLNLYTAFELFIEDLFYSALLNDSGIPGAKPVIAFQHRDQAEDILLGGRDYLKWLPMDRGVRPLAGRLLVAGNPFNRLDRHPYELSVLNEVRLIRNAIAHDSVSAQGKVKLLTSVLRARRRHAAGLLQSERQGQTQHFYYSGVLRQVASALAEVDDVVARNSLSLEKPYPKGEAPGPGEYACTHCQTVLAIKRATQKLPRCPVCYRAHASGTRDWRRIYVA